MMIRQRKIIKEQAEKLYQTYMEHGKLVVAYSFYETIFSKNGNDCEETIKLLQLCRQAQIGEFICIDTEINNKHSFVKTYCNERNIPLDKITDRVKEDDEFEEILNDLNGKLRKSVLNDIYVDVYISKAK